MNAPWFPEPDDRQFCELGEREQWIFEYEHQQEKDDMSRYAKDDGGGFEPAPLGSHIARCIRLIDLGTQEGEYQGVKNWRNQILITWELCDEKMADGQPYLASLFVTNSLGSKAKLRAILTSWRGRDFTADELKKFDLQSILGAPCILSIVASDTGKHKVAGVMKLPKGSKAAEPVNPQVAFWLDESFNASVFESLSDGIKKIIMRSPEYAEAVKGKVPGGFDEMHDDVPEDEPDDVPF